MDPSDSKLPRVEPISGEAGRYFASASDEDEVYIVDLLAYHGNGECGCEDFVKLCNPNRRLCPGKVVDYWDFEEGGRNANRTICKHIYAARNCHTNAVLQALSEMKVRREFIP